MEVLLKPKNCQSSLVLKGSLSGVHVVAVFAITDLLLATATIVC